MMKSGEAMATTTSTTTTTSVANEIGTKVLLDPSVPMDELLGSVTTYNNVEGSEMKSQLRTSARVFKKMQLDSAMAALSATEKKDIDKPEKVEKTEKKDETKTDVRSETTTTRKPPIPRPLWNPEDKNLFFEALNEYGKDFDAIHQYISNKLKRKGVPDNQIKTKEQVRHLYYRTWHKISKYLRFSDDVKKVAQELYCLINYGELRKKLTKISEKTCMKLNELIYTGFLTVRVKGKPIRIRTPMCKALRRLNQLDETNDDIKLPSRITLELKPKDMETWMRVQEVFQNPRVKTALPLQKRISSLLTHLTERWKSQEVLEHEKLLASAEFAAAIEDDKVIENVKPRTDPPLRILPPPDAVITLPTINIGEFFTMQSVCMNSYEERIGVKTSGEQLWMQAYPSLRHIHRGASRKSSFKRSRAESFSEKSPAGPPPKRPCLAETTTDSNENCVVPDEISLNKDIIDEAVETILALQNQESAEIGEQQLQQQDKEKEETLKLEEEALMLVKREHDIARIRLGWTLNDCATLTIGDLYLMFGADSKISLEYAWDKPPSPSVKHEDEVEKPDAVELDNDDSNPDGTGGGGGDLSGTLKKLLSVAKLHYRKNIVRCPCGHVCGAPAKPTASRAKTTGKSAKNVAAGDSKVPEQQSSHQTVQSSQATNTASVVPIILQPPLQKFPSLFRRPISPNGVLRAQLDSLQRLKPRYCNRKGRRPRSKQIIVERKLSILANKDDNDRQIVSMNIIAQDVSSLPRQIAPKLLPTTTTNGSGGATYVDSTLSSGEEFKIISLDEEKIVVTPDVLDNATTASRVGSPTSISNLLDMAFKDGERDKQDGGGITSFEGLLSNNTCSTESATSPTRLLKDNDNQWLNSEVGDFSFSSFLGHLESPAKNPTVCSTITPGDDSRMCLSQDVDAHLQSLLTESSMDLTAKFADLAAQVVDSKK